MSATNRGTIREDSDNYKTPEWLSEAIIDVHFQNPPWLKSRPYRMLEPACGDGAIANILEKKVPSHIAHELDCVDIRDTGYGVVRNFLEMPADPTYDLVLTNPPYSLAKEYVDHGRKFLRKGGWLFLLLRCNFFGSQKRAAWWRENIPAEIHITPRRPSFTKQGTDATEYAWFGWCAESTQKTLITILDTEFKRFKIPAH